MFLTLSIIKTTQSPKKASQNSLKTVSQRKDTKLLPNTAPKSRTTPPATKKHNTPPLLSILLTLGHSNKWTEAGTREQNYCTPATAIVLLLIHVVSTYEHFAHRTSIIWGILQQSHDSPLTISNYQEGISITGLFQSCHSGH